ncbi:hypothetical protein vBRpoSV10_112 [Ruegeria phage vB_RpoS-V10]|nr:hypothetical protein DSS3P8_111 [Roseobacter phage DSS3P8]AWY09234.1 hypothetical protein vBRpoSV10_112 [Ruegeria phage vB_RpoS-V10]
MVQAISPRDVPTQKAKAMPAAVLEIWNNLIAMRYSGSGSAYVDQCDAIAALLPLTPNGNDRQYIFDNGWLDIEPIFRDAGWYVHYDKPGYNETYEPSFTFRAAS